MGFLIGFALAAGLAYVAYRYRATIEDWIDREDG